MTVAHREQRRKFSPESSKSESLAFGAFVTHILSSCSPHGSHEAPPLGMDVRPLLSDESSRVGVRHETDSADSALRRWTDGSMVRRPHD